MARLRTLKPGFFTNDVLAELPFEARLLFAGLWCIADREGRLPDRPRRIKAEVLPYDDVDVDQLLDWLAERGFVVRYAVAGERCIQIVNFGKHQNPHVKEPPSSIPPPDGHPVPAPQPAPTSDEATTGPAPVEHQASTVPAPGKHGAGRAVLGVVFGSGSGPHAMAPAAPSRGESYPADFERFWREYPGRANNPKRPAFLAWARRRRAGVSADDLARAAENYATWIEIEGRAGTDKVAQAVTFLNQARDEEFAVAVPRSSAPTTERRGRPSVVEVVSQAFAAAGIG